jgi:hypothetical protein
MMKKTVYVWIMFAAGMGLLFSCNSGYRSEKDHISSNTIVQQPDGTISLKLEKADCYSDMVDPSVNTAEWNVMVSKSGRYNVWISSATKDTTDLRYKHAVLVSVQDKRLEALPECDKVIRNSSDVSYPYFRADSFMGSMFIKDPGEYSIQVISEKILPEDHKRSEKSGADISKLISVSFTPVGRR